MPPTDTAADTTTTTTTDQAADQAGAQAAAAAAAKSTTEDAAKTAAEAEAAKAAAAAKEAVVYTLTLPKDAVLEASAVERMTAFAKANTLSPDAAQNALAHANAEVVADRARQIDANAATFKKMAFEEWPAQIKAHPKYGGEHHIETITNVKRLADVVITPFPERVEALNKTGWGNHPLLVEIFADIGARMANDTLVQGGAGGTGTPKSPAQILYPDMNP